MAQKTELVLLAGGQSRRMGSDKLSMRTPDGGLIVADWLRRIAWPGPTGIVLPPGRGVLADLRVGRVVHDAVAGEGPLRGVLSALEGSPCEWLVCLPVDMPGIERAQLEWLLAQRDLHPHGRVFLMQRNVEGQPQIEPLPLLIHCSLLRSIEMRLLAGRRSLHGLAEEPAAVVLQAPGWPASTWMNLNRPDDLAAFLAQQAH